jgi:hypothetical protein
MPAIYPVSNAYATTPSYSGTFIPTLWASKLIAKFYAATMFGEIANTDYEGEITGQGDKVTINTVPSIAIRDYVAGTALTYDVPTGSTVDLTIDQGKYFGFRVNDVLAYQAKPDLMNMFTNDASEQMKVVIDRAVLLGTLKGVAAQSATNKNMGAAAGAVSGAYSLGTDVAPLALTGSNVLQLITQLSSTLDEANIPESDRYLLISPQVRQVLMQSNLANAQFTGDGTSPQRNGKIGMIDRFTVYVSNQMPRAAAGKDFDGAVQAGTAVRHAIIAGHKSGLTFASQITKVEDLQDPNDFGKLVRGLNVYGYKVVKPESLAIALVNA